MATLSLKSQVLPDTAAAMGRRDAVSSADKARVDPAMEVRGTAGARESGRLQAERASAEAAAQEPGAVEGIVSGLNEMAQSLHREVKFTTDDQSGEMVVKVVDRETDEVIRQLPPEEVLRLRERMQEASGVLFRGQA